MFADDDLVTMTHAVEMYEALPNAEFAVVPGTSHFLTQEKPHLVNQLVLDFLTNDPVQTVAPIRRAHARADERRWARARRRSRPERTFASRAPAASSRSCA